MAIIKNPNFVINIAITTPIKLKKNSRYFVFIFQKTVDKRREERGASERERSGGRRHYVGGRELDRRARRHRETARDRDRNKESDRDRDRKDRDRDRERERR